MSTSTSSTSTDVNSDPRGERGAIMVMGVFLSCSLIAGMWYMMGIGDAILWRDRSQEAADSIAFTSAAIHARGMNFISAVNIMMLIIVSVYLILSIVRSILDMVLWVTGDPVDVICIPVTGCKHTKGHTAINMAVQMITFLAGGFDPPHGFPFDDPTRYIADNAASRDLALNSGCTIAVYLCCLGNHPLQTIADIAGPGYVYVEKAIVAYQRYVLKPILPVMHAAEVFTAKLSPWVAAGAAIYEGQLYYERTNGADPSQKAHHWGLAISPSMFTNLKRPQKIKRLKENLQYIKHEGNGCGPTMCADGQVSRSGWYKKGTSGTSAVCCDQAMIDGGQCTRSGICSHHGGIGNQDNLYEEVTVSTGKDHRLGLPVQAENMNMLCEKALAYLGDFITNTVFGSIGFGGHGIGDLINQLFEALGGVIKKAYCTYDPAMSASHSCSGYSDVFPKGSGPDDANEFWAINEDDACPFNSYHPPFQHAAGNGPMKVVDYAPNGGDYMQVYAIMMNNNYNPSKPEYGLQYGNWTKLRLAVGPKESGKTDYDDTGNGPWFYIAEAEFYHDCDSAWGDSACNGNDKATYRMDWRTRLRRVHKPVYISDLTGYVPGSVSKILSFVTSHSAQITKFTLDTSNVDIGAVMGYVETLANLAGPDALMPTIYH